MMKQWWESLSEREQKQVSIIGVVLIIALFYWAAWLPLANSVAKKQAKLDRQIEDNAWAKDAIVQIKANSGRNNRNRGTLSQIVNNTSRNYNIVIARMNPKDDTLNLVIEEIVFSTLMQWLGFLEHKQGLKIHNIDISQGDEPGKVRVSRLVLGKA
jgi:general secretion pathway protein M